MKAQLCRCNNCNTVYIDGNPSNQPEFEADGLPELELLNDGEFFLGCPKCLTDAFLIDIEEM